LLVAALAIGAPVATASSAGQSPFAARINAGPISLSCARTGPAAGQVRVNAEVAYADLRAQVQARLGERKRGRGVARLILLTPGGKVLAKTRDRDRLQFGFKGNHVYDGQAAILGKRASRRVLRYAHGRAGCARASKRDRQIKVVIRSRETLAKAGAGRPVGTLRAGLAGSSWVTTLRRASNTSCAPYPCFETAADVLAWSPKDVRPFDKASVSIAPRMLPPKEEQRMLVGLDNGPWSYWSDFDLNAQGSASTGNVYNFSRWQYVDSLYYYAHKLLAVPPTVWVNAAHRNGVSVLGVMTADCTGCSQEMNHLFENSRTKTVDQLHDLAAAYGFDGWLIDVERQAKYSKSLREAMEELRKRTLPDEERPDGKRPVQVITYKAGKISMDREVLEKFEAAGEWQSDYDHQGASSAPKETYEFLVGKGLADQRYKTYWGTDVYVRNEPPPDCNKQSGPNYIYNGFECSDIAKLFANQRSARASTNPLDFYQSLALFAPGWTAFGGRNNTEDAPAPRNVFQAADERFWSGVGGYRLGSRGCELATQTQNSVSSLISPRSPLTSVPFTTTFDTGEGDGFAVQGRTVGKAWNLLSVQDALPSAICSEGEGLRAAIDYDDPAFDGGSSLQITGTTSANGGRIYLYEAAAKLPARSAIVLRYLTGGQGPPPLATFWIKEGNGPIEQLPSERRIERGWTYTRTDLPGSKELTRLGISFSGSATVNTRIGEIGVVNLDSYTPPVPIRPTEEPKQLTWNPAPATKYYNVWAVPQGASCSSFVGRTLLPLYDRVSPLFAIPGPSPSFLIQPVNESGLAAQVSPDPC
jgi:mannosyl-glycoprotein endo-beta-N-acetylglucosaminidase